MARKSQASGSLTFQTSMACVRIDTNDSLRTLFIDDAESTAIDFNDPLHLEFEYMQHVREAMNVVFAPDAPLRILHLGGAGCALARSFAAQRPGSRQLAIEIDPELATIAREYFDVPSSPAVRIRTQDARTTLDTNSGSWHVIIRDTFIDGRVPAYMASQEAYLRAASLLAESGIYCVNVAGERGLGPVYREVQGARAAFAHVVAIADPATMKKRRFGNVILVASHVPLDTDALDRLLRKLPMPARFINETDLLRQSAGESAVTDAEAGWPRAD